MASDAFFDTNILVYAFSDEPRSGRALELMRGGGIVSVQSLGEFSSVALRKMRLDWAELRAALTAIETFCEVAAPIDLALHRQSLDVAERYRVGIFDAMLLSAALRAECRTFWSEDMNDGLVLEGQLTIRNPFAQA